MANLTLFKSKHLLPFAAILKARGVSVTRLLKKANLPATCLDDPDTLIPAVSSFHELAAKSIGCPNISLESTRHLDIEHLGAFGQALLTEPTAAALLHKFRELVATETSNVSIELRPLPNGDLWFGQQALSNSESGEWHKNLYIICWMLKIVRLADPAWSPAEIYLASKATPGHYEAIEMLGSTAHFHPNRSGFMIPAPMLALPIIKNPVWEGDLEAAMWSTAPRGTYAGSLKQLIQSYANDLWLSVDQVSEVTGNSVRTMQRQLWMEQTSYSNLIQESRSEMAGKLLVTTDMLVAEIAHQLGYKNQGHFTRAFRRWAKVTPSEFRKHRSLMD